MLTARNWREIPQRYRLEAARCKACSTLHFPPRLVCKKCGKAKFEREVLSDECTLHSFTVVRVPSGEFVDGGPYAVGIVETKNGARLTCQVVDVDFDDLKLDMPLRFEFRRVRKDGDAGILCYGYKAVPA